MDKNEHQKEISKLREVIKLNFPQYEIGIEELTFDLGCSSSKDTGSVRYTLTLIGEYKKE